MGSCQRQSIRAFQVGGEANRYPPKSVTTYPNSSQILLCDFAQPSPNLGNSQIS